MSYCSKHGERLDVHCTECSGTKEAPSELAGAAGSAASYVARWMSEDGGKVVIVGDWHEVLTAATLFIEMGATKIEIETVREMPLNDKAGSTGPKL